AVFSFYQLQPRLQVEADGHIAAARRYRIHQTLLDPGGDIQTPVIAGVDLGDHADVKVKSALPLLCHLVQNGTDAANETRHEGDICGAAVLFEIARVPVEVERDAIVIPAGYELFNDGQFVAADLFVGE